jgi:hypothetical protein
MTPLAVHDTLMNTQYFCWNKYNNLHSCLFYCILSTNSQSGVWLQMGRGLVNQFIDHLYTQLGTTSNYNAIPNLTTLQITTAPA